MDEQPQIGQSQKVVIVDDNESLVEIYSVRLKLLGYEVHAAYDGEQAMQVIESVRPDLVLLDLMVPKIAGDQILHNLRQTEWGKDIKVLIMSNLNEVDAPKGLREEGIVDYRVKANLVDDQLDRLVDSILKPEGQEEDVAALDDEPEPMPDPPSYPDQQHHDQQ